MDAITIDLLCNHKKEIKKKDYGTSRKKNNNLSNVNVAQILSNNISIFNISQYHNNDLDNILNIMIETSANIIQHKKNISKSITNWWEQKRIEQEQRQALRMVKDNGSTIK